jgi:hypothetical protein
MTSYALYAYPSPCVESAVLAFLEAEGLPPLTEPVHLPIIYGPRVVDSSTPKLGSVYPEVLYAAKYMGRLPLRIKNVDVFERPHRGYYVVKLACETNEAVNNLRKEILASNPEIAAAYAAEDAACKEAGVSDGAYTADGPWAHITLAVVSSKKDADALVEKAAGVFSHSLQDVYIERLGLGLFTEAS